MEVLQVKGISSKIRLIQGLAYFYFQVTKCTFNNYGPSGTVENKDGLCVLAINIINEKIYIFLWFWFLTLCVWTGVHLFIRILSMALINFRYVIFGIFFLKFYDILLKSVIFRFQIFFLISKNLKLNDLSFRARQKPFGFG